MSNFSCFSSSEKDTNQQNIFNYWCSGEIVCWTTFKREYTGWNKFNVTKSTTERQYTNWSEVRFYF